MSKIYKRNAFFKICLTLAVFLILFLIVFSFMFLKFRPVIINYAVSNAETILLNASNDAVISVLDKNDIQYDDIINLTYNSLGYVTSLQTDIKNINYLKSKISLETANIVSKNEFYPVAIPFGTFLGNEFFSGLGPMIKLRFQLTSTSVVDFEHQFSDAGINQVLHKIIIKIETKGSLITVGSSKSFSVKTTAIAAQTVIVGATPESFTEVIEDPMSDTAGIINDYGAY